MNATKNKYTGCLDANGIEIQNGQTVKFMGKTGKIVFENGAYGIAFDTGDPIDWTAIKREVEPASGPRHLNRLNACMNDHFISLWEIIWNFDIQDGPIHVVEIIGD